MDQEAIKDDEALAAMLMSWYMSGYHTGFYQVHNVYLTLSKRSMLSNKKIGILKGMKQQQNQIGCQSCKCYTRMQR